MPRPHCAAFIATSLDGFIARADGRVDWLDAFQAPGEDYGFAAFLRGIDTLVMGRATWETVQAFSDWPYGERRVVVLTHRPAEGRHGERFLDGDPSSILAALHSDGARSVYVDGGATVSAFFAAGVIDALTVSIVPVLLGDGIRLFQWREHPPKRALVLSGSRAYANGLVRLDYRVAGP